MENKELLKNCITILENSKAHDLTDIDVTGQSSIADVMLICTGTSNRHVVAIAQRLSDELLWLVEGVNTA